MSNIKLIHGDCMDVMREYPDKYFDLAVVDPPYGINHSMIAGKQSGTQYGNAAAKKRIYKEKDWDKKIPDEKYFKELFRVSKAQIIWGGNYFIDYLKNTSSFIVWDKDNGDNQFADCELAWTYHAKAVRKIKYTWNGMIQQDMKNKEERFHPTQKPIKLYQWIFDNYATLDMKVLDTHLGSASSAIAAHQFGIIEFVGVELDEDYYEAATKRFKQATAQVSIFDVINNRI